MKEKKKQSKAVIVTANNMFLSGMDWEDALAIAKIKHKKK